MDCKIETSGDPQRPVETIQFGPRYLEQRLYQLCPPEVGDNGHSFNMTHRSFLEMVLLHFIPACWWRA
jgi:hypothetical protein